MLLSDGSDRHFKISTKKLGSGAFADVFLAEWVNGSDDDDKPFLVAAKCFKTVSKKHPIDKEIEIMQSLDHPNIVKLISSISIDAKEEEDSSLYVFLEYCAGGDFHKFLHKRRLSEKYACRFTGQIAQALQYLNERGIIHRDLKPHNILMSRDKKILKIADFGFARIMDDEAFTQTQCGSPLYMAPEVLMGDEYTNKADLWSVGVILYEMLCGERPFKDINSIVGLRRKVQTEPIRFRTDVSMSRPCRNLLKDLLQKDFRRRIDFHHFFEHEWFQTDWDDAKVLKKSRPETVALSKPIAIPTRQVRMDVINNYVERLSSAPARTETPIPMFSPSSANENSMFLSSTPQGKSDPFGDASMFSASSSKFGDFVSTSFSLLKDSFQGAGF